MERIMMIDDSNVELKWTVAALRPYGIDVLACNRALGVQALAAQHMPALILLDVNMPALTGDVLCKFLRTNPATADIPVLLYSDMPAGELRVLVERCGADGYIEKNHNAQFLALRVHSELANSSEARVKDLVGGVR